MRFATFRDGKPDGQLALVSRDNTRVLTIPSVAGTLQEVLDRWQSVEHQLRRLYDRLNEDQAAGVSMFDPIRTLAPLPRAWQWLDGSAFESHGSLMAKVFGMDPAPRDRPLMYQGTSDTFYPPMADIPFPSEADGIDFEGEFGVVVDETPLGVTPEAAMRHIRLIIQINDWSLRAIAPVEMKTGFGWVQAKPPCSVAPIAVTPDELGAAWHEGRVTLPLTVTWNGKLFGTPNGAAMMFGFHNLVAHAARTRRLVAGTIIGSGTVSNENYRVVGSACITEKRGIEMLDHGVAHTPVMRFGDRIRMEARMLDGAPLFGAIDQQVVRAR